MYTLRTLDGVKLLGLFPSHANFGIGDEVRVRLDVDHLVVFEQTRSLISKSLGWGSAGS